MDSFKSVRNITGADRCIQYVTYVM